MQLLIEPLKTLESFLYHTPWLFNYECQVTFWLFCSSCWFVQRTECSIIAGASHMLNALNEYRNRNDLVLLQVKGSRWDVRSGASYLPRQQPYCRPHLGRCFRGSSGAWGLEHWMQRRSCLCTVHAQAINVIVDRVSMNVHFKPTLPLQGFEIDCNDMLIVVEWIYQLHSVIFNIQEPEAPRRSSCFVNGSPLICLAPSKVLAIPAG